MVDFRKAAAAAYHRLMTGIRESIIDRYWRIGNAVDTLVDYARLVPGVTDEVCAAARDMFLRGRGDWYDDFGWWCSASLRLSELTKRPEFAAMFDYAWQSFDGYAPWVWARTDQKRYALRRPLFEGGVWNSTFTADDAPLHCDPGDTDGICGTQNTVTNGLYLIAATRGYRVATDQNWGSDQHRNVGAYWAAARREWTFLNDWFPLEPGHPSLLGRTATGAFARERVPLFATGSPDPNYRPAFCWAGDQGLLIGGLINLWHEFHDHTMKQTTFTFASDLVTGVGEYLFDENGMKPWAGGGAPGGDDDDYKTGISVLYRYLLQAWSSVSRLKQQMDDSGLTKRLIAYAEYRATHAGGLVRPDPDVIESVNNLASYVFAINVLEAGA